MRLLHALTLPLAVAALLAGAPVAQAERAMVKADWERFLHAQPLHQSQLIRWLGYQPTVEPEVPAQHYMITGLAPYAGGIDLYTGDKGEVTGAYFYLASGPLYSDAHVEAASKLKTAYTLTEMARWYGTPDKRGTVGRTGAAYIRYNFQGDAKRQLTFSALPTTDYLHRVSVERE